ncbi:MAG: hypothetical protein K2Q18_01625 [Bdellovibrionales bacterium]|nr:hypothetical protein [Bdellovibrionales bacterium]
MSSRCENVKYLDIFLDSIRTRIHLISEEEWLSLLHENYHQFEILDQDNNWVNDLIAVHEKTLVPENAIKDHIQKFIDEVRDALISNTYFMDLLEKIPWRDQRIIENYSPFTMSSNVKFDELSFLKYIISFAYCLEKINVLLREETNVLDMLINLYRVKRKENNFYRPSNILAIIKFHSIELPLVRFLKARIKNEMPPNFGKYILMLNIFEASLVDLAVGFFNNARSTIPLIIFSPNFKGQFFFQKYQKGLPSDFSKDGKALLLFSPAPKEWADLYQVWNMAFVAQFAQAPYLLAKLLIPSVSNYANRPTEYMHNRITALHLTMNYLDSAINSPKIQINIKNVGPAQGALIKLWGKVNKSCGDKYKNKIRIVS